MALVKMEPRPSLWLRPKSAQTAKFIVGGEPRRQTHCIAPVPQWYIQSQFSRCATCQRADILIVTFFCPITFA